MTEKHELLAVEGIRFFGEMSASISHEIKNVLAIINENAGLLQDMIGMQEKGVALSLDRLSRLSQSISRQVERGNGVVKGMNRFAHSADNANETVEVNELVHFMTELAGRLIAMKGPPPRIEAPDEPVWVSTNRFFLENLVWNCLRQAMEACPPGETVIIRVEEKDNHVRIRFSGLDGNTLGQVTGFPASQDLAVAQLIGGKLTVDNETFEICIILS